MQLKLATRSAGEVTVVDCAGRIVFGDESSSLRDHIKGLLPGQNKIVLNLAEVGYIDSGGIGTLVSLYTSVRQSGGAIKLASLTKRVDDLLQITKLLTVFETFDNEQAAVDSFKGVAKA